MSVIASVPVRWWRGRRVRVGALTGGLALGSIAVQAAVTASWPVPTGTGLIGPLALAVLFALTERFVVTFPVRRGSHTVSLSEIPLIVGLVLLPLPVLAVARLVGALVGLTVFRRQRSAKLAFNLALYLTQVTVAGEVFDTLTRWSSPLSPAGWAGSYAGTFAADVVSLVAVTAVIAVHDDGLEWRRLLSADVKDLVQVPMVAVTTTLGLVAAVVVHDHPPAAGLLGVLALAVFRVFQRYSRQTQGHAQVEALYRFTGSLGGSRPADEVAHTVLTEVRDLVRAESAELRLHSGDQVLSLRLSGQDDFTVAPVSSATGEDAGGTAGDGMTVPLRLADASGTLSVRGRMADVAAFTEEHRRLLAALAGHAAVALSNARLVDRLRHTGLHDALTGLPNRRHLLDELAAAIAALPSGPGPAGAGLAGVGRVAAEPPVAAGPVGVLLLDLDRFQEINDALGHRVGDGVLGKVAQRLDRRFAGRATVARLGGDEFALVVPAAADADAVLALAAELVRVAAEPIEVDGLVLTTPASVGVALAPAHGTDPDRLLQCADIAMYAAKRARTGVRVYRAEDDQNTPRRLALMADLRSAIERDELEVHYQPKVDPVTGRVVGAEALSRWRRSGDTVPPDEFIPLAERSGLIRPLTGRVLDEALAACAGWRELVPDISVAVNLSPQTVADPTLADEVRRALRRHGLPPSALTLEITETGIMADPERSRHLLLAMDALGVRLSVDDFGTGHSSLGRLADLPIGELKIDKGFIRGLTTNRAGRAVTDAALHLGRDLGISVVAEGVETEDELDYLRSHGCRAVQGFYYARPLPGPEFAAWLAGTTAADRPVSHSR